MLAYAVKTYVGHHDNGEHGAGSRMLNMLTQQGATNTAVFVTRDYGGIHLGQRRFLYIDKVTREALNSIQSIWLQIPVTFKGIKL